MIGFHVRKDKSYVTSFNDAFAQLEALDISRVSLQMFVTGPQNDKETVRDDDIREIRDLMQDKDAQLVIHGSYIDNPWKKNAHALHNIKKEMTICAKLGAQGVIIHLTTGADSGMEWFLDMICKHVPQEISDSARIWLEIGVVSSRADGPKYSEPDELEKIFLAIARKSKENNYKYNIGLCIDSAHLWSCGVSMQKYVQAKTWIYEVLAFLLEDFAPEKKMHEKLMIHLNDSGAKFGSGIDRHESLCKGAIWSSFTRDNIHQSGLYFLLKFAAKHKLICVLETPKDHLTDDLRIAASIMA